MINPRAAQARDALPIMDFGGATRRPVPP